MRVLSKSIMLLSIVFALKARAAEFKGYARSPGTPAKIFAETIDRFKESKTDFLILIQRHQSFLYFPKKSEQEAQVRIFLQTRLKQKKIIEVEVDPITTRIFSVRDVK